MVVAVYSKKVTEAWKWKCEQNQVTYLNLLQRPNQQFSQNRHFRQNYYLPKVKNKNLKKPVRIVQYRKYWKSLSLFLRERPRGQTVKHHWGSDSLILTWTWDTMCVCVCLLSCEWVREMQHYQPVSSFFPPEVVESGKFRVGISSQLSL